MKLIDSPTMRPLSKIALDMAEDMCLDDLINIASIEIKERLETLTEEDIQDAYEGYWRTSTLRDELDKIFKEYIRNVEALYTPMNFYHLSKLWLIDMKTYDIKYEIRQCLGEAQNANN